LIANGVTVRHKWGLEHRSRNRIRSVDPVWVIVDMRDSRGIHPVEF